MMDSEAYFLLSEADLDAEEDNDEYWTALACGLVVAHGLLEFHRLQAAQRSRTHQYLTRPELICNPPGGIQWSLLGRSYLRRD
jgi:hypothetical protein